MGLDTFTNLDGRIGRQTWWLGTIITLVAAFVVYFIVSKFLGGGIMGMDPQKMMEPGAMENMMKTAAWQQLISLLVLAYPTTALMSKRLNDRSRPAWLKWLFWLPTIVSTVLSLAGMGYTMTDMGNGVTMPAPTTVMTIVGVLSLIVGIWALVELGFLRGIDGPNEHGQDPLAR